MRCVLPAVLALVGCYAPAPPEGAPCGDGLRPCPAGQVCSPADNRCYRDPIAGPDAPRAGDAGPDAPPAQACTPRRLLTGGVDVTTQGWTIERVGAGTIMYDQTTTTLATTQGARQLIVLRDAFPPDRWSLQIVGQLVQSGGCTPSNAAATVMASFHAPIGDTADRARMLCFTETTMTWGDGTSSIPIATNTVATVRLERASQGIRAAILMGNGTASMTAGPFTSNGSIAIGDQSTEMGLDSILRITSVDLMCP